MIKPRIAFDNRFWSPQDLSWNPYVALATMMETSWCSLAYGFGAAGTLKVYETDSKTLIPVDKLYEDAVSLSLGVFTIDVPHDSKLCNRLICNCKIQ